MERSTEHRFGKHNRLLNAAAFGRVFEKATRSRDKWFTVLCRENEDGPARLGLAISKKHCRKATARNKIKRIVRSLECVNRGLETWYFCCVHAAQQSHLAVPR